LFFGCRRSCRCCSHAAGRCPPSSGSRKIERQTGNRHKLASLRHVSLLIRFDARFFGSVQAAWLQHRHDRLRALGEHRACDGFGDIGASLDGKRGGLAGQRCAGRAGTAPLWDAAERAHVQSDQKRHMFEAVRPSLCRFPIGHVLFREPHAVGRCLAAPCQPGPRSASQPARLVCRRINQHVQQQPPPTKPKKYR
jgi:hypothetical protein